VTTLTNSSIEIPDFTDPATYIAGIPHDAFDELRSRPGLYWQKAADGTYNGGFWVVTRFKRGCRDRAAARGVQFGSRCLLSPCQHGW